MIDDLFNWLLTLWRFVFNTNTIINKETNDKEINMILFTVSFGVEYFKNYNLEVHSKSFLSIISNCYSFFIF